MRRILITTAAAAMMLAGCTSDETTSPADGAEGNTASPTPQEPVSIIRPDIEEARMVPLEPLAVTIGFGESGEDLSDGAIAQLEEMLTTRQFEAGGPITIGGHSDSGGTDRVNMRMSQARADAVKEWLMSKGVAEDRITTIAFGEQNPVADNALPDGQPDESGRATNRRAEVKIEVPEGMMVEEEPKSLTEAVVDAQSQAKSAPAD